MQSHNQRLSALSYRNTESPGFQARNATELSIE